MGGREKGAGRLADTTPQASLFIVDGLRQEQHGAIVNGKVHARRQKNTRCAACVPASPGPQRQQ